MSFYYSKLFYPVEKIVGDGLLGWALIEWLT